MNNLGNTAFKSVDTEKIGLELRGIVFLMDGYTARRQLLLLLSE